MNGGLILEPFAGPGGMSTALAMLGRRAVGVELDRDACRTAVAAGHARVRADVATFPLEHLAGRVEGVAGSPPCQAWSKAGKRLGLLDQPRIFEHLAAVTAAGWWADYPRDGWHDGRSPLVLEPVRWVSVLRPAWVVCEQVPDVLPFWRAVARWLRTLGYSAECGLLSAEQFGVPQTRLRAFLVARLAGPVRLPVPTHQAYGSRSRSPDGPDLFGPGLLPWVSMADALGWDAGRPARTVCGDRSPRWAYGPGKSSYGTGWTLETEQTSGTAAGRIPIVRRNDQPAPTLVANADRWELRNAQDNATAARGADEPAGTVFCSRAGNLRWQYRNGNQDHAAIRDQDQPAPTVHFGARSNKVDWVMRTNQVPGATDDYQRRDSDQPSPAVSGQGRSWALERDDDQAVRVEVWQAAVLQSFPPDYPWQGTKTSRFGQVGNCVPPLLGAAVAGEVLGVDWQRLLWGLERAS